MHGWIKWILGCVATVPLQSVCAGCGNDNDRTGEKDKDPCWYELWYFWLIVALFVLGAAAILFFYCKQQAKHARHQNSDRHGHPQMFLPPPPPSYETPGHQPPPYHIAINVHFREYQPHQPHQPPTACSVDVSGRVRGQEHSALARARECNNEFLEVEDVSDIQQPYIRPESVPPPYSLTDDGRHNMAGCIQIQLPCMPRHAQRQSAIEEQSTGVPPSFPHQDQPPAYPGPGPGNSWEGTSSHAPRSSAHSSSSRLCNLRQLSSPSSSILSSSTPPGGVSTTAVVSSLSSHSGALPISSFSSPESLTSPSNTNIQDQTVLIENRLSSGTVPRRDLVTNSTDYRNQNRNINRTNVTTLSRTVMINNNELHGSSREGLAPPGSGQLDNRFKSNLRTMKYANNLTRRHSQDQAQVSRLTRGSSRRTSLIPRSRPHSTGNRINPVANGLQT